MGAALLVVDRLRRRNGFPAERALAHESRDPEATLPARAAPSAPTE
jgi:hypothetical protein